MAANDGSHPVREPFPGIVVPDSTGAMGSAGTRGTRADEAVPAGSSGLPGIGTVAPLRDQMGEGEGTGTTQPGQTATSILSPGPAEDYTSSGPEPNRTDHWARHPWQQSPGGH